MKKIISLCLFGAAFIPFTDASNVTTNNYSTTETEAEAAAASDTSDKEVAESKAAMRGWFIGLGLTQGGYKTSADETGFRYRFSGGDIDEGAELLPERVRALLSGAGIPVGTITFTQGSDNQHLSSFDNVGSNIINNGIAQNKLNKLGALLVAGWGDFDGNLYYGVQIALDISGNKDTETSKRDFDKMKLESKGFRPYFEVMLGRYFETIDALLYLKGGVTYSRAKLYGNNDAVKLGSFAPLVGIGAKKAVTDNMTICTEVGYVFEVNKQGSLNGKGNYKLAKVLADDDTEYGVSHEMEAKVRNRGYNIRVFATYNF